jgi:hypothetical protein
MQYTHNYIRDSSVGIATWLIDWTWVRAQPVPMHLGLADRPFVPHVNSWEPCCFTEAPDSSQVNVLNIFWFQEEGAQMRVSEWGQGLTFAKNVGRGFLFHSTFPTQRRYSNLLRAGWSGDQIPLGARFSAPVQNGPGAHPASYTMGTGSFLGVKWLGRGTDYPPPSCAKVEGRTEVYICSPSGPSWPVLGWPLPLPLHIIICIILPLNFSIYHVQ